MELNSKNRKGGVFTGWTGIDSYKFENGQIWVQKKYKYKHHHSFHPPAQIWKDGSRFFLMYKE